MRFNRRERREEKNWRAGAAKRNRPLIRRVRAGVTSESANESAIIATDIKARERAVLSLSIENGGEERWSGRVACIIEADNRHVALAE